MPICRLFSIATITLFLAVPGYAFPGAKAGEAAMYNHLQCISSLGVPEGLSKFAGIRPDSVVIDSTKKNGVYILQDGKTYFAAFKDAQFKKEVVEPFAPMYSASFEIATESKSAPLQLYYSKSADAGKTLQLHTNGADLNSDHAMLSSFQKQPKRAVTAVAVSEAEFESAFAAQIDLQKATLDRSLTWDILRTSANDSSQTVVGAALIAYTQKSSNEGDGLRLERQKAFWNNQKKRDIQNKYDSYVKALEVCSQALSGAPQVAAKKALESVKKEFDSKVATLAASATRSPSREAAAPLDR